MNNQNNKSKTYTKCNQKKKNDGLRKKVRQYREKLVDTGIQYNNSSGNFNCK